MVNENSDECGRRRQKFARGVSTFGSRLVASKLWTHVETPWPEGNQDRPCVFFSNHLGSAESVGIWKLEVVVGSRPLQLAHHNGLAFASFKPTGICGRRRSPYYVAVRLMIINSIFCRILIQWSMRLLLHIAAGCKWCYLAFSDVQIKQHCNHLVFVVCWNQSISQQSPYTFND